MIGSKFQRKCLDARFLYLKIPTVYYINTFRKGDSDSSTATAGWKNDCGPARPSVAGGINTQAQRLSHRLGLCLYRHSLGPATVCRR